MFRIFKNKINNIEMDEQVELINIYIRNARNKCGSFEMCGKSYISGGKRELIKLISELQDINERISQLESAECIEYEKKFYDLMNINKEGE